MIDPRNRLMCKVAGIADTLNSKAKQMADINTSIPAVLGSGVGGALGAVAGKAQPLIQNQIKPISSIWSAAKNMFAMPQQAANNVMGLDRTTAVNYGKHPMVDKLNGIRKQIQIKSGVGR